MDILTYILNIFGKKQTFITNQVVSYDYDIDAYLVNHKRDIEAQTKQFIDKYGSDFDCFFYRKKIDIFIRKEVLPFIEPNSKHNHFLDYSHWNTKHPFNFPGPFYTGESDTCCTGHIEAPNNVIYDEYGMEIIFKQPQTYEELLGIIGASAVEVFDSYSCDGNDFWTYKKCKEWWKDRFYIISEMKKTETIKVNAERFILFENYLKSNAGNDLKKYCYFLENGNYPKVDITKLPQLE